MRSWMPETRARPASSPALPATSLTLELVEAVHGVALAASPRVASAAPHANIAARARSERRRGCCEEKDFISASGSERLAANLAAGGHRCDSKTSKTPHAFVSAIRRKRPAYPFPQTT